MRVHKFAALFTNDRDQLYKNVHKLLPHWPSVWLRIYVACMRFLSCENNVRLYLVMKAVHGSRCCAHVRTKAAFINLFELCPVRCNLRVSPPNLRYGIPLPKGDHMLVELWNDTSVPLLLSSEHDRCRRANRMVGIGFCPLDIRRHRRVFEGPLERRSNVRIYDETTIFGKSATDRRFQFGIVGTYRKGINDEPQEESASQELHETAIPSIRFLGHSVTTKLKTHYY